MIFLSLHGFLFEELLIPCILYLPGVSKTPNKRIGKKPLKKQILECIKDG